MGEGDSTFNPGNMGLNNIEHSEQYAEREDRRRAVLARLVLARRARLLQESREPEDVSSDTGGVAQDFWASMPRAGRDFQALLAEEGGGTAEELGRDESDPLDFSDLPVF